MHPIGVARVGCVNWSCLQIGCLWGAAEFTHPAYDSFRVEPPLRRRPARRDELAVELAGELRDLWPTCVPGFLKDRRDLGVRDEVLPALRIPVEEHPDPALLIGIAKGL
jgi:hypothetical protein